MSSNIKKCLIDKDMKYKNRLYLVLYFIIYVKAFYAYSEVLNQYSVGIVIDICNILFLIVAMYKIIWTQKYTFKQVVIFFILAIATFYTDRVTDMFMFFPDFLLMIATQDVDLKSIIKKMYKIQAVYIMAHVIMYGLMWVFNRSSLNFSVRMEATGYKYRHQFLLSHANIASMMLLWTILGYLFSEYEKLNVKKIVCAYFLYILMYLFTDSNSGLIILTIITFILLAKKILGDSIDKYVTFLARYLFAILSVIFVVMMAIFTKLTGTAREIWMAINNFFTGRLLYGSYAYDKYGLTLLGQPIQNRKDYWQGMWIDAIPSDNTYMWTAVGYGIVYLFIISFLFWKYSKRASFQEKLLIIAYSLYTVMELYVTFFYLTFAVILIMRYLWEDSSPRKKTLGEKYGTQTS